MGVFWGFCIYVCGRGAELGLHASFNLCISGSTFPYAKAGTDILISFPRVNFDSFDAQFSGDALRTWRKHPYGHLTTSPNGLEGKSPFPGIAVSFYIGIPSFPIRFQNSVWLLQPVLNHVGATQRDQILLGTCYYLRL